MPALLALAILALLSIVAVIGANVIQDLFGDQIKGRVKSILPEGTKTDEGTITK